MNKKKLLHRLSYYLIRASIFLFSLLPFSVVKGLARIFGWLLAHIFPYRKDIIQSNLSKALPEKDALTIKEIKTNYYQHLSDLFFETIKGISFSKAQLKEHFKSTNEEIFNPYLTNGQSCLLIGSHYNNWELGCMVFPLWVPYPTYTVYKSMSNPYVDKYINSCRTKWGMKVVPMSQVGRTLIEKKEQASIFLLVADQSPASTKDAIWVNFFNRQTPFMHGVEKIARKTNYPIFYFSIKKKQWGAYEFTIKQIPFDASTSSYGTLTKEYAKLLEQEIKNKPEKWLWSHRRWKRTNDSV